MISSLLFALGFLSLSSTSNNRQLLQTPITPFSLFDGTQVIYATIPDLNGPGLSAITLGTNEVISNVIGIFDGGDLQPVDPSNPEIIRSATIDPITNQLILLYQEMLDTSSDPQQRLIRIAPSSTFGLLSTQYSNIMAMEVGDVDIDGLTEITFDCAGNLIGITREGETYAFEVDGIEINEIDDPIGQLEVAGVSIMDTALTDAEIGGFTGLTYNWLSNTFVAVGGPAFGQAGSILIEFTIFDCVLTQLGTGSTISDPDGLCFGEGDGGIVDIEFRGQSEYVISCMDSLGNIGLAVLINDGVNVPLIAPFVASGDTPGLIEIGNSFGGALIPSIDTDGDGINELGIPPLNPLCLGIGDIDCDAEDANIVTPGIGGVGVGGFSIGALDGTVGDTGAVEVDGGDGDGGEDVSELAEELEETLESLEEEVEDVVSEEEELEEEVASDEEDDDGEDDESTDDDGESEDDDDDEDGSESEDDDDDGSDDESDDDNEDDGSDDDDDDDDYDGDSDDDDDDDDDDSEDDDDGDDDDDDDDDDSDDYDFFDGAEGISNEYRNGFFSNSNEYGETVISLSESTLANLWGIGLLFLLINISFLVICYYKHWMRKQNHDTIEEVIDLES